MALILDQIYRQKEDDQTGTPVDPYLKALIEIVGPRQGQAGPKYKTQKRIPSTNSRESRIFGCSHRVGPYRLNLY